MYAKIKNGVIERYPYHINELKKDNPQTSFPSIISEEVLSEYGVVSVLQVSRPSVDDTKNISEGNPELVNGVYTQKWIITDASSEEILSRKEAFNSLQKEMRANAYIVESDPLFFKVQREEATQEEWLAKIEEIKNRFPYQE